MAVLAAEMVGLKNGVGMMVILGREMFNGNLIMLGICIVGITGYVVDSALVWIQRKLLWWTDRGEPAGPPQARTPSAWREGQSDELARLQPVGKIWPAPHGLAVEALRDVEPLGVLRRIRRHPRPERLRQEHAARADRGARADLAGEILIDGAR